MLSKCYEQRATQVGLVASSSTVSDCSLDGSPIPLDRLALLSSVQIADIVSTQQPGDCQDHADDYDWSFHLIPIQDLRCCNEDGEEPEGGWKRAYQRHQESDRAAVSGGSPEYAGRQKWLRTWSFDTAIYPIFVVLEGGQYRLLDGYHRLAAAFWHDTAKVFAFVGQSKSFLD